MNQTTPPGWYPDTQNPGQQRYWDGAKWTEHMAPVAGGSPSKAGPQYTAQGGQTAPLAANQGSQPSKQNWFLRHKVLSAVLAVFLFFVIVGAIGSAADSGGDDSPASADKNDEVTEPSETPEPTPSDTPEPTPSETPEPTPSKTPEPTPKPKKVIKVTAAKILKEFEDNEAAADLKYGHHKLLEVTGFVSKVDTEFLHDDRYVINVAGPDYEYAFATVNCDGQSAKDVAKIKVGQQITVGGDFQDGGDLGIELGGCHIVRG